MIKTQLNLVRASQRGAAICDLNFYAPIKIRVVDKIFDETFLNFFRIRKSLRKLS